MKLYKITLVNGQYRHMSAKNIIDCRISARLFFGKGNVFKITEVIKG
jgi:hypothetical protein